MNVRGREREREIENKQDVIRKCDGLFTYMNERVIVKLTGRDRTPDFP